MLIHILNLKMFAILLFNFTLMAEFLKPDCACSTNFFLYEYMLLLCCDLGAL
jgi:hypothetical protein